MIYDRTGRKADLFLAVGSEMVGDDLISEFGLAEKGRLFLAVQSEINGGDSIFLFFQAGHARAVTAANDGGARRRRDLAMEIARLLVKRDEAYIASLKERLDWSGDHRRRIRRREQWRRLRRT